LRPDIPNWATAKFKLGHKGLKQASTRRRLSKHAARDDMSPRRYDPGLVCSDAEIKATVGEDMRASVYQSNTPQDHDPLDSANDLQDERALGPDFLMIDYMKVRNNQGISSPLRQW
jgi:hypothetical protein